MAPVKSLPEPEGLRIRPARPDEARLVRRLVLGAGLDPSSLKWRNFLVAELGGQVVGCGQVKPYPGCRELGSLVVRKPFRGQGVGATLIRALLAREGGPVHLLCRAELATYYANFGFEEIAMREAPRVIRLKLRGAAVMGALLGIRITAMCHDPAA